MKPFAVIESPAVSLLVPDIDTDVITPMKRLMERSPHPLSHYAFESMRYLGGDADTGRPDPSFPLNQTLAEEAAIMFVGENFGCGSSRESAPSAIADLGFRCLIGSSFGGIFFNNCFQNGILPIVLPESTVIRLAGLAGTFTVDLAKQVIDTPDREEIGFDCNPFRKQCLLEGLDDIGMTLARTHAITVFTERDQVSRPWLPLLS